MDFFPNPSLLKDDEKISSDPVISLILEPRSLLVIKDLLYTDFMHGIEFRHQDVITDKVVNNHAQKYQIGQIVERKLRYSLTIRHVEKVLKNIIKLR
jgi:alkylated DNA repair protein alkB family protein 6